MRLRGGAGAGECASVVGIKGCESGAPKRAERYQIGPEATGLGKAAPGPEPEASMEVPTAERFTPYLSAIWVSRRILPRIDPVRMDFAALSSPAS